MNYRERMRKAVECPQFGNIDYGEWGSLNLVQRKDIKRLLDEMDRADEYIKTLYFKNENLQSKIDKVNKILNANTHVENIYHALCNLFDEEYQYEIDNEELNNILKEDK